MWLCAEESWRSLIRNSRFNLVPKEKQVVKGKKQKSSSRRNFCGRQSGSDVAQNSGAEVQPGEPFIVRPRRKTAPLPVSHLVLINAGLPVNFRSDGSVMLRPGAAPRQALPLCLRLPPSASGAHTLHERTFCLRVTSRAHAHARTHCKKWSIENKG